MDLKIDLWSAVLWLYCCKSVPANTCRMLVHSLLLLLLFLILLLRFILLLPLAISSPASSSPDDIFDVPSNADYKPGFMPIPGIEPRKKGARRCSSFAFSPPPFFRAPRDPDKSSSHEIQDEYRWVTLAFSTGEHAYVHQSVLFKIKVRLYQQYICIK